MKALILNFVMRKGRWGERYFPIDTMSNWLAQTIKNTKYKVKELARDRYLILHKGNTTASLNPKMKREIVEYIERYLKE